MTEAEQDGGGDEAFQALKARANALEQQLRDAEAQSALLVRAAELKAEAVRAGIVDLDGLRLVDPAAADGADAPAVIARLRQDKPWLFAAVTTGSVAPPPPAAKPRVRLATEMTLEEWRAARADLLRRR